MMRFDPARERALKAAALAPEQIRAGAAPGFFKGSLSAIPQGAAAGAMQVGGLMYGAAGSALRGYNQVLAWQNELARLAGLPESGEIGTEWLDAQRENTLNLAQSYKPDPMRTGMAGQVLFDLSRIMTQVGAGAGAAAAAGGAGASALLTGAATTGGASTLGKFAELKKSGVDDTTALQVAVIEGLVTGGGVVVPAALGYNTMAGAGLAKGAATYLGANVLYGAGANIAMGVTERTLAHGLLAENYPAMAAHYQPLEASALIAEGALGAIFGAVGARAGLKHRAQEVADAALTARAARHAALDTAPGVPADPNTARAHSRALNDAIEQVLGGRTVHVADTGITEGNFVVRAREGFVADTAPSVKTTIKAQLEASGRFASEAHESYASLIGNYYAVQAERLGTTPETLFERYPLRVAGEDAEVRGQHMRQQSGQDGRVFFQGDYAGSHRPGETGARAHDITNKGEFIPADFYDKPQNYGDMRDAARAESLAVLQQIRGNPDAKIRIYRAAPSERINDGDWVTLSRTYAEQHRESNGDASWNVIEAEVLARDVQFAGDDINEFGYFPNSVVTHFEQSGSRGYFDPATNTIALLKNADPSTFVHESGHFFLEMQADIAGRADTPAAIKADMQTVLDWFGVHDLAQWRGLSLEQKRPYHEQFARGFEKYLAEGKSPSAEMQGLFERLRDWLVKVYRDLSNLNVELTPEVRGVFDRLLATDEQIARHKQTQSALTPEARAELVQRLERAGQIKPRFDAALARIADDTGATLQTAAIKGVARAVDKIADDYAGNARRIKDLVRATMVVNDAAQLAEVVQRVERLLGAKPKRDGLSNDADMSPEGYRDVLINVEIDGFPAELQISTPEMMAAKAKAHPLYVEKSRLERKIESENREPTASEQEAIDTLAAQQRNVYAPAWEATKARNWDSLRGAPLRENESDGNLRPPGTSQAMATQLGVRDTGISSTSANRVPSGNESGNSITGITEPPDGIIPLAARASDDLETRAGLALLEERPDLMVPLAREDGETAYIPAQAALRQAEAELAAVNKNTLDMAVQCGLRKQ